MRLVPLSPDQRNLLFVYAAGVVMLGVIGWLWGSRLWAIVSAS